jgi:Zn-finger nucleic acid-binding protein
MDLALDRIACGVASDAHRLATRCGVSAADRAGTALTSSRREAGGILRPMGDPYRQPASVPGPPCPRCPAQPLVLRAFADREVHACPACGGLWLAPAVFNDALVESRLQDEALAADRGPAVSPADAGPLPCPTCRQPMRRDAIGDVLTDSCRRHGIWLDPTELARLIAASRARAGLLLAPAAPATESLWGALRQALIDRGIW